MNNTSQITPTMLTLLSINFAVPEGNGSILILQTILTGTITHFFKLQIASCAFALGIPSQFKLWDAKQWEGNKQRLRCLSKKATREALDALSADRKTQTPNQK